MSRDPGNNWDLGKGRSSLRLASGFLSQVFGIRTDVLRRESSVFEEGTEVFGKGTESFTSMGLVPRAKERKLSLIT